MTPVPLPHVLLHHLGAPRLRGRSRGRSGIDGEIALRLQVVPPLSHATTWIEVLAAGQSTEARTTLPLRWQ